MLLVLCFFAVGVALALREISSYGIVKFRAKTSPTDLLREGGVLVSVSRRRSRRELALLYTY